MTNTPSIKLGEQGSTTRLLQQRLIDARFRLDRHVNRLTRLNRLSTRLLGSMETLEVAATFAEGLIDVLDLEIAAVWVLDHDNRDIEFAAHGLEPDVEAQRISGAELLEMTGVSPGVGLRLNESTLARFNAWGLGEAVIGIGRAATGESGTAILLAGNTVGGVGLYESLTEDVLATMGSVGEIAAAFLNISAARHRIDENVRVLRESEERLGLVLSGTNDGWWDWVIPKNDCLYSLRWWTMLGESNPQACMTKGFWMDRVFPEDREHFAAELDRALNGNATGLETELRLLSFAGAAIPVLLRGVIRRDKQGKAIRFAGTVQDLTERKRHEEYIKQLAYFDVLTELPNRRLLEERLTEALATSERTKHYLGVIVLDIDRFKILNDTHGHAVGDALLREVARRLTAASRTGDLVSRLGGDEFVLLLPDLGHQYDSAIKLAEGICQQLLSALEAPIELEVGVFHHGASLGVAVAQGGTEEGTEILKHADVALYQAKSEGRQRFRLFKPEMQEKLLYRLQLDGQLREAFNKGSLVVYYQPQVDQAGVVIGAEALMRWMGKNGPTISPAEFIPIAEESGFIHELGRWSLHQACTLIVAWGDYLPPSFRVSVNVSAQEFLSPDYHQTVIQVLEQRGVPGRRIRLELTEAAVLKSLDNAAERMWALRAHGIEFSLDDFGTGYSSLSYLRKLPISEVKIDRSYVMGILTDPHDAAIIRSILTLCSAIGMSVVAEGVETQAQREKLIEFGCERFQGFLFGPAVAPGQHPDSLLNKS